MPLPSLRRVIESGPSVDRRRTRPSRVVSPRAANTGAASGALARLADMRRELLRLARPASLVHPERLGPPRRGELVEAGLDDRDRSATWRLLQLELDECHRLGAVVDCGIDGGRVPAVREAALGLDLLDQDLHRDVRVARAGEASEYGGAGLERAVELHPEPAAEFLGVGEGPPHTGALGAHLELLFDPVGCRGCVGLRGHWWSTAPVRSRVLATCNACVAYDKCLFRNAQQAGCILWVT